MELNSAFENMPSGTHVCSIYSSRTEQLSVIVPFMIAGLRNNEKCVSIVSAETKEAVELELGKRGVDVNRSNKWGQFIFTAPEDTYIKDGVFDPDRLLNLLKHFVSEAVIDGFHGLRIIGEANWYFSAASGTDRLVEYESRVNDYLAASKLTALCLYDENIFSKDILKDVLRTHPKVIVCGKAYDNEHYVIPAEFLQGFQKDIDQTYDSLKDSIIKKDGKK